MLSSYTKLIAFLAVRRNNERGATAVEYAMVIGLVATVIVGALVLFGPKIIDFVDGVEFTSFVPETQSDVT